MTNQNQTPPEFKKPSFHCPYCDVLASQKWEAWKDELIKNKYGNWQGNLTTAECKNCGEVSIWRVKEMIYPLTSSAPKPDNNMPPKVKKIYEEARAVSIYSSRAAAALLRLALEELTVHLGETEGTLNARIGNLHKRDFPEEVIEMLDIVRITANEGGAHSGAIDLTGVDGVEVVNTLFWLVNYIIDIAIKTPARIKQARQFLPADKLKGAEDRDKSKKDKK
ncbi:MAG: DUF4145 domain-containing protein [Proteobacteria bacterium]|nr:DUF4145 domain-containing protein [Pseudomonadota bacterium]